MAQSELSPTYNSNESNKSEQKFTKLNERSQPFKLKLKKK